jgi:DNA-binding response OmpR family regulator
MNASILIADSDPELVEILGEYLAERGYSVDTAAGVVECVTRLRRSPPDILLIEWDLLWRGGAGVLDRMREQKDMHRVAVVLMTSGVAGEANPDPEDRLTIRYLRKPFLADSLLDSLRSAVTGRREEAGSGRFHMRTSVVPAASLDSSTVGHSSGPD